MSLHPTAHRRIAQKSAAARAVRTPAVTPQEEKDNAKIAKAVMYARKLRENGRT